MVDDLSKFQKISNLARELMRHGQASTMDVAMKMAQQQVESGMVSEFVAMKSAQPAAPVADQLPEVKAEVKLQAPEADAGSADILRAVENLVSEQQSIISRMAGVINTHTNQMQAMSNKINGIIAEITSMKEELNKIKESPVAPSMKKAQPGQTQFKPEIVGAPPQSQQSAPPAAGVSHARTGTYKPEDVSIEKFFYYGGGKR